MAAALAASAQVAWPHAVRRPVKREPGQAGPPQGDGCRAPARRGRGTRRAGQASQQREAPSPGRERPAAEPPPWRPRLCWPVLAPQREQESQRADSSSDDGQDDEGGTRITSRVGPIGAPRYPRAPQGRTSPHLVQPAHRCPVAGVPEGLELGVPLVPRSSVEHVGHGVGRALGEADDLAQAVLVDDGVPRTPRPTVWWIPSLGVCDQREPSEPALGSSVTSYRRLSQPRREEAILAPVPASPAHENSARTSAARQADVSSRC